MAILIFNAEKRHRYFILAFPISFVVEIRQQKWNEELKRGLNGTGVSRPLMSEFQFRCVTN